MQREIPPELSPVQVTGTRAKAQAKFVNQAFFNAVKASLNPQHYVECGNCGAIEVDTKVLVRALHTSFTYSNNTDGDFIELARELLNDLIEAPPEEFDSYEELQKWEYANERRICRFLLDDYGEDTCTKHDEVLLFYDSTCGCFGKNKIAGETT